MPHSNQPNPYAQAQGRQLGLSAAQVSTLNFGWHTIYAIENIQKRAPMLSSSEAFGMVQGMAEQAAQQYVTAYLASTKKHIHLCVIWSSSG